ncbi:hypothetical protein BaRGS_00039750 [Batillaria attramentaria]|uniref:Alpha-galactosidase n=1 Tax=Batillaria attramentaria TaxID=370345 RepID=A0ABD0J316_9CAEN
MHTFGSTDACSIMWCSFVLAPTMWNWKLMVTVVLACLPAFHVTGLDNGLALKPPMGWLSWERFRCETDCKKHPDTCISEKLYITMADKMVSDGYKDAGYTYVHIDDCWAAPVRDADGNLQADPTRFPNGIKPIADYLHERGLKLGIYTDIGYSTCQKLPGTEFYMKQDAETFARWGVDLVKTDGCNAALNEMDISYPVFGFYLNQTGRPMVYCCSWAAAQVVHGIMPNYTSVRQHCNIWRNYLDVQDSWTSVLGIIDFYGDNKGDFASFSGPGGFSDPDQVPGSISVWLKPLSVKGSYAVAVLNKDDQGKPDPIQLSLGDIGLTNTNGYNLTDVFANARLGYFKPDSPLELDVDPTSILLIKAVPL